MTDELIKARELLEASELTCVFIKNGEVSVSRERGVAPLLSMLDSKKNIKNASCADKVVGKGAAFLYVLLGVRELYAKVVSTPAKKVLTDNGIKVYFDTEVAQIRNRTNTGYCPIESAVLEINDPKEADKVIRARVAELRGKN